MADSIDTGSIEIPPGVQESWQKALNLISKISEVPAALIMRKHTEEIEVFATSKSEGNPYERGEKAKLKTGLYCETVMACRDRLIVPNALVDPLWDHNPDLPLGMISYMGWPVAWPNGDIFGTICLLDSKENGYDETQSELLYEFKELIEFSLRAIYEEIELHKSRKVISHIDAERRKFEKLSTIDSLTKLYNRRSFDDLSKPLYQSLYHSDSYAAIFVIDVDKFKTVNDQYGHLAGDEVLVKVADSLSNLSRRVDILARYGGDEFIMLAPDTDPSSAVAMANRILETIRDQTVEVGNHQIKITLSIGIYSEIPDSQDIQQGIAKADRALFQCKEKGRNQVSLMET